MDIIKNIVLLLCMLTYLSGKKTYIVALVALVYALTGFLTGNLDANAAIQVTLAALGAAGLRHGISTTA